MTADPLSPIFALIQQNKFREALVALNQYLNQHPADGRAWALVGIIKFESDMVDDAAEAFNQAQKYLAAEDPTLNLLGGDIAYFNGQMGTAVDYYRKAYLANINSKGALHKLLRALTRHTQPEKVEAVLASIPADLFQTAADDYSLFMLWQGIGQSKRAITALQNAISKSATAPARQQLYQLELACAENDRVSQEKLVYGFGGAAGKLAQDLWAQINTPLPPSTADLTVLVTTNITKKLKVNAHKAPPKADLIAETLASFSALLQPPANTKIIICYDQPKNLDSESAAYKNVLQEICQQYGAELMLRQGNGLKNNVLETLATTHTGYFTLLEHDWLFAADCPTLGALINLIQANSNMHMVWYNKRANVDIRADFCLWPAAHIPTMPLLGASRYSNNPGVLRTAKLQRDFVPIFMGQNEFDQTNSGAGGIEERLQQYINQAIFTLGFGLVHQWLGGYIYGKVAEPARLTHTGI